MDSETEQEIVSFVVDVTFLASSTDWDSKVASLVPRLFCRGREITQILKIVDQIVYYKRNMEFTSFTSHVHRFLIHDKLYSEWKLLSLITQIVSLVSSMDLDPLEKPESELMSLIKQIISLFNSKPDSDPELISLITQAMHLGNSVELTQDSELLSLISQLVSLKLEPDLTSLIRHIISRFKSLNWEPMPFISLCPRVEVKLEQGKFCVTTRDLQPRETKKGNCLLGCIDFWISTRKKYFYCPLCNGEFHEGYENAPLEVKHPLHPKHSLQLVFNKYTPEERRCYCCEERIGKVFYYCEACDYAMDIACVDKPRLLATDHPMWHEHTLALFPSQASFPCNICALTHSSCPFYVCPPCDFVVHKGCLSLPRVIRISRHPHRISFTPSFDKGDWFCGVCRKKIHNDYGGYSCIKEKCSYAAHSKCATQRNVWDGEELEGVPEEIEEDLEPFVRIRDGTIQHFSHQQHHLTLAENTDQDYKDNKLCQACVTPIYFGNFYSCMQCEFILHEACANFPRKIYHPIHPHLLTLATKTAMESDFT